MRCCDTITKKPNKQHERQLNAHFVWIYSIPFRDAAADARVQLVEIDQHRQSVLERYVQITATAIYNVI